MDEISLRVAPSQTVSLVGESGSGKTTIGRSILGLAPVSAGRVVFNGEDITHAAYKRRRSLSAEMQVVFQDPYSSLNPTRTVGQTLGETLRVHNRDLSQAELATRVGVTLEQVGLPADAERKHPAHFSGGQRQRIAIARAIMCQPRLIICDEPTSALDLSVQAQVLNLLRELQDQFQVSYLFISHNLTVVKHLSHRIIVLYHGRVMEEGPAAAVYESPGHPYTRALLAAALVPDPKERRRRRAMGAKPASTNVFSLQSESCPFVSRCPHAIDVCSKMRPRLEKTPDGTLVACHRWEEVRNLHHVAPASAM